MTTEESQLRNERGRAPDRKGKKLKLPGLATGTIEMDPDSRTYVDERSRTGFITPFPI